MILSLVNPLPIMKLLASIASVADLIAARTTLLVGETTCLKSTAFGVIRAFVSIMVLVVLRFEGVLGF